MRRRKIGKLPRSETPWEFPKPKDPNQIKPKIEEIVDDEDEEEMPNAMQTHPPSGERPMTCWPPRNPGGSGHIPKPESVKKAEEALLEKWKLPEGFINVHFYYFFILRKYSFPSNSFSSSLNCLASLSCETLPEKPIYI